MFIRIQGNTNSGEGTTLIICNSVLDDYNMPHFLSERIQPHALIRKFGKMLRISETNVIVMLRDNS
jgi:hypothetical protein